MRRFSFVSMLVLWCSPAAAPAQGGGTAKPLFASFEPLTLTLSGDLREVFRNRDTTVVAWVPATLELTGAASGAPLPVELATRGHFRLQASNCKTPPLRIRFPAEATEGTLWAGQRSLKLVTHCQNRYDQLVLQEYLAYRSYNLLTEMSLRPRLARLTYADTRTSDTETHWAFLLEDDDDLARRVGATLVEQSGVTFEIADTAQAALMSVFFYMIGNTDWSLPYLHNVKVLDRQLRYYPVPYDFDWSGIVNAPYARPDPRLRIRSVRERLYRGACFAPTVIRATLDTFLERREAIRAEYESLEGLDPKRLRESLAYLDEFFDLAADPKRADRAFRGVC